MENNHPDNNNNITIDSESEGEASDSYELTEAERAIIYKHSQDSLNKEQSFLSEQVGFRKKKRERKKTSKNRGISLQEFTSNIKKAEEEKRIAKQKAEEEERLKYEKSRWKSSRMQKKVKADDNSNQTTKSRFDFSQDPRISKNRYRRKESDNRSREGSYNKRREGSYNKRRGTSYNKSEGSYNKRREGSYNNKRREGSYNNRKGSDNRRRRTFNRRNRSNSESENKSQRSYNMDKSCFPTLGTSSVENNINNFWDKKHITKIINNEEVENNMNKKPVKIVSKPLINNKNIIYVGEEDMQISYEEIESIKNNKKVIIYDGDEQFEDQSPK